MKKIGLFFISICILLSILSFNLFADPLSGSIDINSINIIQSSKAVTITGTVNYINISQPENAQAS